MTTIVEGITRELTTLGKGAVYSPLHKWVGWFDSDEDLAAGRVGIFKGEQLPPPQSWLVKGPFDPTVGPVADYLLSRGLKPYWMSDATAKAASDKAHAPIRLLPKITFAPADVTIRTPSLPGVSALAGVSYAQIALVGGLGLLAVLMLRRGA